MLEIMHLILRRTAQVFFDIQFTKNAGTIDSLKVWNDSSFIQTYRNIPVGTDITDAGLFVTTYSGLNVSPSLLFDFVMEVATEPNPVGDRIVSIDFQNASRDYTYWIDKDIYLNLYPGGTDSLSNEEQQHIKDVIIDRFYSNISDSTHKPKFYFAKSGEMPPVRPEGGVAYGILFITHYTGGNGYGDINYGNDYLLDASFITIGDPTNVDGAIIQEVASIISSRTGSQNQAIGGESVFSEVAPMGTMQGIDIKLLKIEENIA